MTVGIRDVVAVVQEPLVVAGFSKRAGQIFTLTLGEQVLGWLGLNAGTERSVGVRVNPVVGIRHQEVERWVAQLCGDKFHPYQPPTVSQPLTALASCPHWFFAASPPVEVVGRQLAQAVLEHGVPFMRQTTSLVALLDRIEQGWGFHLEYRRPVVLALLGETEKAMAALDHSIAGLGERSDPAAARLRSFANAFRDAVPSLT